MKIWSGSAAPESGNEAYRIMLEKDIDVDKQLIPYEILSLMAYNLNAYEKKLHNSSDARETLRELLSLYDKKIELNPELEDVHGNVENLAIKETHGSARNMRMFLSRNEQVHTDVNFFLMDILLEYLQKIRVNLIGHQ